MKIRKFKSEDAQVVSKIMNEAFKACLGDKMDAFDRISFSPEILRKISHGNSFDGKKASFVAEEKGKVIGYIRGSVKLCGLGSLEVVGISPSAFSKGVGTALMKGLEKFWRQNKMRKISTCVSAHNTRALIYYVKNGFVPEGYQKDHFKKGVDEIILGRFLTY
jgi:ribosomal protein S18 acetylase RimI-like enzyme